MTGAKSSRSIDENDMRQLRHFGKLLKELCQFAWQNKIWWIVPMFLVLLVLVILAFTVQGAMPQFIYTLF